MSAPAVPVPVLAAVARDTVVVVVEVGQLMARQARHRVPEHHTGVRFRYLHHVSSSIFTIIMMIREMAMRHLSKKPSLTAVNKDS